MIAEPQPFDPGYDYEADKAIEERIGRCLLSERANVLTLADWRILAEEAVAEIRALRNLIKHMERRINNLTRELELYDCGEIE